MGIGMKLGRDRSIVGGGTKGMLGLVGSAGGLESLVDLGPKKQSSWSIIIVRFLPWTQKL